MRSEGVRSLEATWRGRVTMCMDGLESSPIFDLMCQTCPSTNGWCAFVASECFFFFLLSSTKSKKPQEGELSFIVGK